MTDESGRLSFAPFVASEIAARSIPQLTGSDYNIEECFVSTCQSDTVKNALIQQCKDKGYGGCDGMYYQNTFYKAGDAATFAASTKFSYDTSQMKVQYSQANAYTVKWNNQLTTPQQQVFKHTVQKTTSQTFTNTVTSKVSSSITVEETAGLPEVVQEKMSVTVTAEIDVSSTKTVTKSTTQTWEEDQTINVPPNTCVEGCMIETNGDVSLQYSSQGRVAATYTDPKYGINFAAQCCYTRPGGSGQCAVLGGAASASGWSSFLTPGHAVQLGQQQGIAQCGGFGVGGDEALFEIRGTFRGGVGFNVSIATVECGNECTVDAGRL